MRLAGTKRSCRRSNNYPPVESNVNFSVAFNDYKTLGRSVCMQTSLEIANENGGRLRSRKLLPPFSSFPFSSLARSAILFEGASSVQRHRRFVTSKRYRVFVPLYVTRPRQASTSSFCSVQAVTSSTQARYKLRDTMFFCKHLSTCHILCSVSLHGATFHTTFHDDILEVGPQRRDMPGVIENANNDPVCFFVVVCGDAIYGNAADFSRNCVAPRSSNVHPRVCSTFKHIYIYITRPDRCRSVGQS